MVVRVREIENIRYNTVCRTNDMEPVIYACMCTFTAAYYHAIQYSGDFGGVSNPCFSVVYR